MNMGDRIKERRLFMGYTQEELAHKLGLQKSAIAKYENGRVSNIKRSTIEKMATILDCTPTYLMALEENIETIGEEKYKTDIELLKKYNSLPPKFQKAVLNLIDDMLSALAEE